MLLVVGDAVAAHVAQRDPPPNGSVYRHLDWTPFGVARRWLRSPLTGHSCSGLGGLSGGSFRVAAGQLASARSAWAS